MSTAYVPQQPHGGPGPMTHNGPQHQGGPPPPPQHSAPGPGMPPPQHGGTPNGVPMGPQRAPSHPGQQNPQNIQRVSLKRSDKEVANAGILDNINNDAESVSKLSYIVFGNHDLSIKINIY